MFGEKCVLNVHTKQYCCNNPQCHRAAVQMPDTSCFDTNHKVTVRLKNEIIKLCLEGNTYTEIASQFGINRQTVKRIYGEYVDTFILQRKYILPNFLEIKSIYIAGEFRLQLNDITKNRSRLLEIKENNDVSTLEKIFNLFTEAQKTHVMVIAMDFNDGFRACSYECFKNFPTEILVERFIITQVTIKAMRKVCNRILGQIISESKGRSEVTLNIKDLIYFMSANPEDLSYDEKLYFIDMIANYPKFEQAYVLKEELFVICYKDKSIQKLDEWIESIPKKDSVFIDFQIVAKLFDSWRFEIINTFKYADDISGSSEIFSIDKKIKQFARGMKNSNFVDNINDILVKMDYFYLKTDKI